MQMLFHTPKQQANQGICRRDVGGAYQRVSVEKDYPKLVRLDYLEQQIACRYPVQSLAMPLV